MLPPFGPDAVPVSSSFEAAARAKEVDVIVVHKFDHFARSDYDFIIYEKELEELGITLESVSEPGDASTPAGYIGRRMMQVISTWYSKNLAVEVKKGDVSIKGAHEPLVDEATPTGQS